MEEQIKKRLAELQAAEQEAQTRLVAIRTVIAELTALLEPTNESLVVDN